MICGRGGRGVERLAHDLGVPRSIPTPAYLRNILEQDVYPQLLRCELGEGL